MLVSADFEVNQIYVYICPLPRGPPSQHHRPASLGHHRAQAELPVPCAGSYWLSVVHLVVYLCQGCIGLFKFIGVDTAS